MTWSLLAGLAMLVVVVGVLAYRLGMLRHAAQQQARERVQQRQLAALERLGQGWVWQADAGLHLRSLKAPEGGGALAKLATAQWVGSPLTALWSDPGTESPSLPDLMVAQARVAPRPVQLVQAAPEVPPLELLATPLTDERGGFAGYLGVLRERSVAGAPTSAPTDADALSFGYTLSHDLRAPVRVVEGFTRIVKEDYGVQLDRVGNDHLDRVLAAAARMNQMIDALLAMARLSAQPLQRQPVNLSQLAGYVIDELKRGAPERRIEFEVEPGLGVQGDPTLLRQLLENLLGNAWKYTQRCAEPKVRFGREVVDGRPAFVVQDNGTGFDMRSVDRLFGLFQRLHSASDFPGTGVGLASVQRIVARHGGRVWAEAEPGRGAAFHFTLKE